MPISFSTLQIYDTYLTSYKNKRYTSHDLHDFNELRHIYRNIQLKSRFSPVYLTPPTTSDVEYAILLKEHTLNLQNSITSMNGSDESNLFMQKTVNNSAPEFADISYIPLSFNKSIPESVNLKIYNCAMPQINNGNFLPSGQKVLIPEGEYSFDILTNRLNFEINVSVHENDTNEALQERVSQTINKTNIGLTADIIYDENKRSALQLTSDTIGIPAKNPYHFSVVESYSENNASILQYLGLNKEIHPAKNLKYEMDGNEYISHSNEIVAYGAYHISLKSQNINPLLTGLRKMNSKTSPDEHNECVELIFNICPDIDSIKENISSFAENYNNYVNKVDKKINSEILKMIKENIKDIEKYGISVNDDSTLTFNNDAYNQNSMTSSDFTMLQHFGKNVLSQLDNISIDPMKYRNRRICIYQNPSDQNKPVNPYVTSSYSGMLFNHFC